MKHSFRATLFAAAILSGALAAGPVQALSDYSAAAEGFLSLSDVPDGLTRIPSAEVTDRSATATGDGAADTSDSLGTGTGTASAGVTAFGSAAEGTADSRITALAKLNLSNGGAASSVVINLDYLLSAAASVDDPALESAWSRATLSLVVVSGEIVGPAILADAVTELPPAPTTDAYQLVVESGDPVLEGSQSFMLDLAAETAYSVELTVLAEGAAASELPAPQVPLPAALPLSLLALGALGAAARWRRS